MPAHTKASNPAVSGKDGSRRMHGKAVAIESVKPINLARTEQTVANVRPEDHQSSI